MKNFSKNIVRIWGEQGQKWLDTLPHLVREIAQQWQLIDLKQAPNLSYHYVLFGKLKSDDTPIVLKLGLDKKAVEQEARALKVYNGHGCVKLLDTDIGKGALLIERAAPGTSLKTLFPEQDEVAVRHAVHVIKQLHAAVLDDSSSFPPVTDWLKALENINGNAIPEKHLNNARHLARQLSQTVGKPMLLHGDLHHENILFSQTRGWLTIDPKGVIGEPAYEVGAFIRNPIPDLLTQSDPGQIISARITLFSDLLNLDKQRLKEWSYVQAVLSACWAIEDGQNPDQWLAVARIIAHC